MLLQCLIASTNTDDVVIIAPISSSINHTCHHMANQTNLSLPHTNLNDTMALSSSSSITWGDFPVPMQSCSYTELIDPQDQQLDSGACIDYKQPFIYPRDVSKVDVSTVELQRLEKSPSINSIIDMNTDHEVVIIQRNDAMNFTVNDNKAKSYGWNDFPVIEYSDWTYTTCDQNERNNDTFTSDDSSLSIMTSSSQSTTFISTVDTCRRHRYTVDDHLKMACSRRVRFSTINIRYYNVTLGDHPLCCSYPLSLDWSHNHDEFSAILPENVATSSSAVTTYNNISTCNFVQSNNDVVCDVYSGGASLFPHRPHCRRLSVHERQQRLLDNMKITFNELHHLEYLRLQSINS